MEFPDSDPAIPGDPDEAATGDDSNTPDAPDAPSDTTETTDDADDTGDEPDDTADDGDPGEESDGLGEDVASDDAEADREVGEDGDAGLCCLDGSDCDDKNPCTVDSCFWDACCINTPIPDCTPCSEDAECPAAGPCTMGVCKVTLGAGAGALGECDVVPAEDGAACDDGSICTQADACSSGVCEGVGDPATDGLACDDGDPCSVDTVCQVFGAIGTCGAGTVVCADRRLDVGSDAVGRVSLVSLADGGYVARWRDVAGHAHTRRTDAAGTRLGEEDVDEASLCTGCFLGGARMPSGFLRLLRHHDDTLTLRELTPDGKKLESTMTVGALPILPVSKGKFVADSVATVLPVDADTSHVLFAWAAADESSSEVVPASALHFASVTTGAAGWSPVSVLDDVPPSRIAVASMGEGFAVAHADSDDVLQLSRHFGNGDVETQAADVTADVVAVAAAAQADGTLVLAAARIEAELVLQRFDAALAHVDTTAVAHQPGATSSDPAVIVRPDDSIVVAWTEPDGDGDGVFAQRFGADALAAAPAFRVNLTLAGPQRAPRLVAFDDNEWLVAFEGGAGERWTRRFDAGGQAVPATPELAVSVSDAEQSDLALAADGEGVLAVWADGGGIRARPLATGSGAAAGPVFEISSPLSGAYDPSVSAANGAAVVAWTEETELGDSVFASFRSQGLWSEPKKVASLLTTLTNSDSAISESITTLVWQFQEQGQDGSAINIRFHAHDGTPMQGVANLAAESTSDHLREPAIAAGPDDTFVVGYSHRKAVGNNDDIRLTRWNADHDELAETWVAQDNKPQREIALHVMGDDPVTAVVLACWKDGNPPDVRCARYGFADLDPKGDIFEVHPADSVAQSAPRITAAPGGALVVWQSEAADGQGTGIRGRLVSSTGTIGESFTANVTWTGDQTHPAAAGALVGWTAGDSVLVRHIEAVK